LFLLFVFFGFQGNHLEDSAAAADDALGYDDEVSQLRLIVWNLFDYLFSQTTYTSVKRCLYQQSTQLCCFFGWTMTLDSVLPLMVSPVNQFLDWRLQAAFLDNIAGVCLFIGRTK
jgi:hypothetical protein